MATKIAFALDDELDSGLAEQTVRFEVCAAESATVRRLGRRHPDRPVLRRTKDSWLYRSLEMFGMAARRALGVRVVLTTAKPTSFGAHQGRGGHEVPHCGGNAR